MVLHIAAEIYYYGMIVVSAYFFILAAANVLEMKSHTSPPSIKTGPLVSVLIPVRNEEKNIEKCISSLLSCLPFLDWPKTLTSSAWLLYMSCLRSPGWFFLRLTELAGTTPLPGPSCISICCLWCFGRFTGPCRAGALSGKTASLVSACPQSQLLFSQTGLCNWLAFYGKSTPTSMP